MVHILKISLLLNLAVSSPVSTYQHLHSCTREDQLNLGSQFDFLHLYVLRKWYIKDFSDHCVPLPTDSHVGSFLRVGDAAPAFIRPFPARDRPNICMISIKHKPKRIFKGCSISVYSSPWRARPSAVRRENDQLFNTTARPSICLLLRPPRIYKLFSLWISVSLHAHPRVLFVRLQIPSYISSLWETLMIAASLPVCSEKGTIQLREKEGGENSISSITAREIESFT